MCLKFKRKLSKSLGNKASQITIPRSIAEAWADFSSIEMTFDGRSLVIVPVHEWVEWKAGMTYDDFMAEVVSPVSSKQRQSHRT